MLEMIGEMIAKIRKEKGITKTQLASQTDINIGHLTHIEKGERNPSHKALKEICYALKVPYQQFLYAYDQELTDEQKEYKYLNHISFNKVPAISNIDSYIECPYDFSNAAFAYKVPDDSMEPLVKEDSYAFVEINGLIENRAIGLFKLNNEYYIRRLIYKNGKFVLRADNKEFKDINVSNKDSFEIIGKIYI